MNSGEHRRFTISRTIAESSFYPEPPVPKTGSLKHDTIKALYRRSDATGISRGHDAAVGDRWLGEESPISLGQIVRVLRSISLSRHRAPSECDHPIRQRQRLDYRGHWYAEPEDGSQAIRAPFRGRAIEIAVAALRQHTDWMVTVGIIEENQIGESAAGSYAEN